MKSKHEDSFKAVTIYYQQFDYYVKKTKINKPSDKENVPITLLSDTSPTLIW